MHTRAVKRRGEPRGNPTLARTRPTSPRPGGGLEGPALRSRRARGAVSRRGAAGPGQQLLGRAVLLPEVRREAPRRDRPRSRPGSLLLPGGHQRESETKRAAK